MLMEICLCEDCDLNLRQMGIIYLIYLEIVTQFLKTKQPIKVNICNCYNDIYNLSMIYELEKRQYIKLFEKSDLELLIAPTGISIFKETLKCSVCKHQF